MPELSPGETVIATATLPVKPAGLQCLAELYLGEGRVASSGLIPFTSTGINQTIQFPMTMPASGQYQALLDITLQLDNTLIGAFYGVEEVIKVTPPELGFVYTLASIRLVGFQPAYAFQTVIFNCRITNPSNSTLTKTINLMYRYPPASSSVRWSFSLTLAPGQSYDFVWDGNTYGQRVPDAYNGPIVSVGQTICMYLSDEEGESVEVCATRGS